MRAPFDARGNLLHYARWDAHEFRDVEPFEATLVLNGMHRGRSAAYFEWRDVTAGNTYPMFMTDMVHLLGDAIIEFGTVQGRTWRIQKRGANFGIRLADPA